MYVAPKIFKELLIFIKRHLVICVLCLISVLFVAKYSNIPAPSWFPTGINALLSRPDEETTAFEYWEIIYNLSMAFIASIITYIVVQYIPERRKTYKSFVILKNSLVTLYSQMSHLIDMYLFEINGEEPEGKITLKQLSKICYICISDTEKSCKIIDYRNGKKGNTVNFGYKLFSDSKKYAKSLHETISYIKSSIHSAYLDSDILDIITIVESNWFLECFIKMQTPQTKTPGYQNMIFNFDKGFYEFIKCHVLLTKYDFDKLTFKHIKIEREEMEFERERQLFMANRVIFKTFGIKKLKRVVEKILALSPSKERLEKSVGVLLEMLVCYDLGLLQISEVLEAALELAEYIRRNETEQRDIQYALLNCLQIKKRLNRLVNNDYVILRDIMSGRAMPNDILLGASIIYGDYKMASLLFEQLTEEQKQFFNQLPIYRLWPNPPMEPNPDPMLFTVFKGEAQ